MRCCTRIGGCTRPTTRASRWSRPRSCRGTASPGTGARARHARRDVRGARGARRRAARPDPPRRSAVLDRRRAARRHRLVLAPDQPGPGDPRGTRPVRHPGPRPARGQPAHLRPGRAAVPGGAAGASALRRTSSDAQAPVALSRARAARGTRRPAGDLDRHRDRPAPDRYARHARAGRVRRARARRGRGRARRPATCSVDGDRRAGRGGEVGRRGRAGDGRALRSWPRSTRSSGTATCCAPCSTSTTCGRSTSRRPSGAGATTSCRSSPATGSSGASSRGSIARRAPCASSACGGRTASIPSRSRGSWRGSSRRSRRMRASRGCDRIVWPRAGRHRAVGAAVRARLAPGGRVRS